jgi:FtsZ-binding cell division protein ZapB
MSTQEIIEALEHRIAQATKQIEALQSARAALTEQNGSVPAENGSVAANNGSATAKNGSAPAPAPAPATAPPPASRTDEATARTPRAPKRTAKTARTSTAVVLSGTLERIISEHDGLNTGQIAAQTGGDSKQILSLLKELESAGKVKRSGQRRSTRWHMADPMDRADYVERRTAELAKLAGDLEKVGS